MTAISRSVRGSVQILSCARCGATIPRFEFDGETDMDVVGLCSAALCNELDIVLAELDFKEWKSLVLKKETSKLPARFDDDLDGRNYRVVHIRRVEQTDLPEAGLSFAEFRKRYRAPTVIFSCPCCGEGDAVSKSEMTAQEFRQAGGRINPLNLKLVE